MGEVPVYVGRVAVQTPESFVLSVYADHLNLWWINKGELDLSFEACLKLVEGFRKVSEPGQPRSDRLDSAARVAWLVDAVSPKTGACGMLLKGSSARFFMQAHGEVNQAILNFEASEAILSALEQALGERVLNP